MKNDRIRTLIITALPLCLLASCSNNSGPMAPLHGVAMTAADLSGVPDSTLARYREDAAILTSRLTVQRPGNASTQLNAELQESLFHGLMHIYKAYALPQRDTVAIHHFIHAWPLPTVRKLRVTFAPDAPWAQAWAANTPLSGHAPMDAVVKDFGLSILVYYFWSPNHSVVLHTDTPYHMPAVAQQMTKVDGILHAEPEQVELAGNNISAVPGFNHWTFYFQYSPEAGNGMSRIWAFRVEDSGDVQFIGSRSP